MRIRRIFRNTAVSLAGRGLGDVCSLLFLMFFARAFGSDVLGEFWYAMAIGAMAAYLITRGTSPIVLREASQQTGLTGKFIGAAASLQLLIAAGLLALVAIFAASIVDGPRARAILLIVFVYQIGYVLASVFRIHFNATEQMQYNALLETGHKLLILAAGLLALQFFEKPAQVLLVYPLAAIVLYTASYRLVVRQGCRPSLHFDWRLNRRWMAAAFPVFAYGTLAILANRGGIVVLGRTADAGAVGIFAAADRVVAAAALPFVMLTGAVFPVMAKLAKSPDELRPFVRTCLRFTMVSAVPLVSLLVVLREPIVVLAFGQDFQPSSAVLGILAAGIVLTAVNSLLAMLLISLDRTWSLFRIVAASLGVLFAVLSLTVGEWGAAGLAVSVVAAKSTTSLGLMVFIHRQLAVPAAADAARVAVAAGAVTAALYLALPYGLPAAALAAVVVSAGSLVAVGAVGAGDLDRLRRLAGKET